MLTSILERARRVANGTAFTDSHGRDLYLELLKRTLAGLTYEDAADIPTTKGAQTERVEYDASRRAVGADWPSVAPTMIGIRRLDNIRHCIERVLEDDVPGDLIETGVWRGGAVIFMRGVLKAHRVTDRTVWVADSFEGLPAPNPEKYPQDASLRGIETFRELAVSLDQVKANFERYQLLDDQVRFLKGWFKDTLPGAPIERLAVLRLDGDLYESTMDALSSLYGKLSVGGYVIVDDYCIPACRQAIHDFRTQHNINDEIKTIDGDGVYWRRSQ
jgi:hypothetical protein